MLLTILNLLKIKLPCSENFFHYQADFEKQMAAKSGTTGGERRTKKIASPTMLRSLSPTAGERRRDEENATAAGSSMLSSVAGDKVNLDKFKSRKDEKKRRAQQQEVATSLGAEPDSPSMTSSDFVRLANQKSAGGNGFASPSHILNPGVERSGHEEAKNEPIQFEGEMMRKAKENKLKKYWYCLLEKELYVYKHKDDENHKQMINLVGIFIKEEPDEALD